MMIDTDTDRVVERNATPSANTQSLIITPSGKKWFTENEEDASITVVNIAITPGRVLDTIAMPGPIGGIAVSPRQPYVTAVAADRPELYIVDSDSHQLPGTLPLDDHYHSTQVVRFNHDGSLLAVMSNGDPVVTLLDGELTPLTSLSTGNKLIDGYVSPDNALLLITNEDGGTLSVTDLNLLQAIATRWRASAARCWAIFPQRMRSSKHQGFPTRCCVLLCLREPNRRL